MIKAVLKLLNPATRLRVVLKDDNAVVSNMFARDILREACYSESISMRNSNFEVRVMYIMYEDELAFLRMIAPDISDHICVLDDS